MPDLAVKVDIEFKDGSKRNKMAGNKKIMVKRMKDWRKFIVEKKKQAKIAENIHEQEENFNELEENVQEEENDDGEEM